MKYLYIILIGIVLVNCSDKVVEVKEVVEKPTPISSVVEVVKEKEKPIEVGAIEVVESANIDDATLVADEHKVEKRIESDVPSRCQMWSDGCNVCTRISSTSKKASCTVYPACHNRVVSCLQWNNN